MLRQAGPRSISDCTSSLLPPPHPGLSWPEQSYRQRDDCLKASWSGETLVLNNDERICTPIGGGRRGTVLISRTHRPALGKATTLGYRQSPGGARPDLLLVGRPGTALTRCVEACPVRLAQPFKRSCLRPGPAGSRPRCRHARSRTYWQWARVRPLRAIVANGRRLGGRYPHCSADGPTNQLRREPLAPRAAHRDLLDSSCGPPGAMLGSNTYHQEQLPSESLSRRTSVWRDPSSCSSQPRPTCRHPRERRNRLLHSNTRDSFMTRTNWQPPPAHRGDQRHGFEPGFMPVNRAKQRARPWSLQKIAV